MRKTLEQTQEKILARTRSLCPSCLSTLAAEIAEKDHAVYLQRTCPVHGGYSQHISSHPEFYKELREYYFNVMNEKFKQTRYLLLVTGKCNLKCPICFYGGQEFGDMSIAEVREIVRGNKGAELVIFGKEPTCHGELSEIIRLLKKAQGSVSLYTNGIKIEDREYLRELKRARVNKIYLQFDGFKEETYNDFRNISMLERKFKALENLKQEKIDTVINVTVAKGRNEEQAKAILDYAVMNDFVKTVNFISYARSGDGRNFLPGNSTMPDELIDVLEQQTKGKISRDNIRLFQKLFYAYMSFLKKRTCFYVQYFWIFRKGDDYFPIDELIDLKAMEKILDRYETLLRKSGVLARIYLFLFIPKYILNYKSLELITELLCMVFSHALKWGEYNNMSSRFIQLIFSTACDPHKADFNITKRCHVGIIYKDASGRIRKFDENGAYLLKNEMNNGIKKP
jgi:hypothetical protein